ncbi:MAG: hypothetical protein PHG35_03400 [Dehalococcoidales bacterium]|nr:hypothetical protein [Dehalococcoidales bacterium]
MQGFVITGKAKDVFRFIEEKAKKEAGQKAEQKARPLLEIREHRNPGQELQNMMKRETKK